MAGYFKESMLSNVAITTGMGPINISMGMLLYFVAAITLYLFIFFNYWL